MTSIWKLIYELEYWIMIGIGDDIVTASANRPEYMHLVEICRSQKIPDDKIPAKVLLALKSEAEMPLFQRPTFWHLLKLDLRKLIFFWR